LGSGAVVSALFARIAALISGFSRILSSWGAARGAFGDVSGADAPPLLLNQSYGETYGHYALNQVDPTVSLG
jgi:hypothetical protein